MNYSKLPTLETRVKDTTSACVTCKKLCPATVIKVPKGDVDHIIMRRTCPEHGTHDVTISTDARFYWHAQGHASNRQSCGCGPGGCAPVSTGGRVAFLGDNALNPEKKGIIDKLSTCSALIEITDDCDLPCTTCFADAPLIKPGHTSRAYPFDDIVARIQQVIDLKGRIEVLQFSGGEPTTHPQFLELVEWVRRHPKIEYLLINTNGKKLALDKKFAARMGELYRRYDNIQLYLQFDGVQKDGQEEIRGFDARTIRELAIRNCGEIGLPITLAMVVTRKTLPYLWMNAEYGLKYDHIRGISYQPMFLSGRIPPDLTPEDHAHPISVADILRAINEQSDRVVSLEDFTSLPCGNPNCAIIGWRIRINGLQFSPYQKGIDVAALQKQLPDRINFRIEDLVKCGCENTALGELMKRMEAKESNAFRFFIKPFMDERTWDEDRIDLCCTHVVTPSGRLDSFCRYYARRGLK